METRCRRALARYDGSYERQSCPSNANIPDPIVGRMHISSEVAFRLSRYSKRYLFMDETRVLPQYFANS